MPVTNTYPPIGRKGYYSFETVEIAGTRYTWKPNQDRWEISGGEAFNQIVNTKAAGAPPINSRERLPSGEFVGGFYNNNTKGSTIPISNNGSVVQFTDFVFIVKSNVNATLLINGSESGQSPKTLRYSKSDILTGGDKRITVKKDGYTSNVEYIISNEIVAGNIGINPTFGGQISTGVIGGNKYTFGMSSSTIVVKKYVNGQIVSSNIQNGNLFNLDFELKQVSKRTPIGDGEKKPDIEVKPILDPTLTISISGAAEGVILLKNNKDEIELSKGVNVLEDKLGSKFMFRAKSGRYKITSLSIEDSNGKKSNNLIEGRVGTSNPNTLITLDGDTKVFVNVNELRVPTPPPTPPPLPPIKPPTPPLPGPEIVPLPPQRTEQEREERRTISTPIIPDGPDPTIALLDTSARTYDIKDKSGLPIAFRKNEEVEAVTVFVGTKHYVFDNLGNKPVAGIVIPSSAFQQLGRLEIKIIPYDVDELDDTIEQITRTAITRTKEVTEERIIEVRRPVIQPIEVEERYEEVPPPVIPDPLPPYPLPPKPKVPIRIPPVKPKPKQPQPIPPKPPTNARPIPPIPSGGRGSGGGSRGTGGEGDFIDRRDRRVIPNPSNPGDFDNSDGSRIRRTERLL